MSSTALVNVDSITRINDVTCVGADSRFHSRVNPSEPLTHKLQNALRQPFPSQNGFMRQYLYPWHNHATTRTAQALAQRVA